MSLPTKKYIVTTTWANGFYQRTRKYKLERSALDRFVLECDMLTNTVTLEEWQIVNNQEVRVLLADKSGYRHRDYSGKEATLLTVGGKNVLVTL